MNSFDIYCIAQSLNNCTGGPTAAACSATQTVQLGGTTTTNGVAVANAGVLNYVASGASSTTFNGHNISIIYRGDPNGSTKTFLQALQAVAVANNLPQQPWISSVYGQELTAAAPGLTAPSALLPNWPYNTLGSATMSDCPPTNLVLSGSPWMPKFVANGPTSDPTNCPTSMPPQSSVDLSTLTAKVCNINAGAVFAGQVVFLVLFKS